MTIHGMRTAFLLAYGMAAIWAIPARALAPVLVKDINPNGSSAPTALENVGGRLFFQADDGVNNVELWVSDGTEAGTFLVRDIMVGPQGAYPRSFAGLGGRTFFSANDGVAGHELWRTDGTGFGTSLVADINPGAADSWPGVSTGLVDVGGRLFFEAYTNAAGYELWRTDGTAGGTAIVKDIHPGPEGSDPLEFIRVGGTLFFRADDGLPVAGDRELWKSDGTEHGTIMVRDINPSGGSEPFGLTEVGGLLLFQATDGTNGAELWRSDGTEEGTMMVKDINPSGSSLPGQLRNANGTLFFVANDGTNGSELWRSDGTEQGTEMVVDLNPTGSSAITHLTVVNGSLFFVLRSGPLTEQLWKSDGTADGTVMLKEFSPRNYHPMVENLTDVDGTLFFTANDGVHGVELWMSDGTSEGTVLAGDINPGDQWSFSWPHELTNVDGVLFFSAEDGSTGRELWALDTHGATTGISEGVLTPQPGAIRLHASAPNPFKSSTILRFDLAAASVVSVQIYDAAGRHIRDLVARQQMDAGSNVLGWDGRNDRGLDAQSGIYYYRVETVTDRRTGRLVLAR